MCDDPKPVREDEKSFKISLKQEVREYIKTFLVVFIGCLLTFGFIIGPGRVKGSSMEPGLSNGDFVFLWKLRPEYQQGDIVFFKKEGEDKSLVKRIIGTPGDEVDIDTQGKVFVNGQLADETYIYAETFAVQNGTEFPIELAESEYFVMGDNRMNSRDSRMFGVVEGKEIDGKVIFVARITL